MSSVEAGIRSMISVPLETYEGKIGALNVYKKNIGAYIDDDIKIVNSISSVVSEAFEKARLLRRTQSVAEMATLFNTSDHSPIPIYDKASEIAAKAIRVLGCSIFFVDDTGDALELAGTTGLKGNKARPIQYRKGEGLTGWIWANARSLRIYDCRNAKELESISPLLKWKHKHEEDILYPAEGEGLHSFLGVPIISQNLVIGVIRVTIKDVVQPVFSKEDQNILELLAEQIGLARERLCSIEQSSSRLERAIKDIEDVSEISQAVIKVPSPKPESIAQQVAKSLITRKPHWKYASVRFFDSKNKELYFVSLEGPNITDKFREMKFPIKEDSIGLIVFKTQNYSYSPDLRQESKYKCPFDAKSSVTVPVSFGDHKHGVLTVDSEVLDGFTEDDIIFLGLLSSQLAIAFEMSRMIESVSNAERRTREHMQLVAHQLVAPLFALRTHTDNLLDGRITPQRGRIVLESINAQAKIAARTTFNFSLISLILNDDIDTIKNQIHPVPVPLSEIFVDLARDYQPMSWLNKTNIVVEAETLPRSLIDMRIFLQAAGNIVDNAVKYSDVDTDIIIRGERKGNNILIYIEDIGIKLSKVDVEKIFERGYRTKEAAYRVPSGTGLGLWLARHILRLLGGDVWAVPTDSQGRIKFVMQLPLYLGR